MQCTWVVIGEESASKTGESAFGPQSLLTCICPAWVCLDLTEWKRVCLDLTTCIFSTACEFAFGPQGRPGEWNFQGRPGGDVI